ncbi:hypothetical protein D3C80_1203830 [compost metagenome]
MQANEVHQCLLGAHLGLLLEQLAHLFQRHARPHGEDEFRALHQAGVVDLRGENAVRLLDQRQRDGPRLQHGAEQLAQVVFQHLEGTLGVVVLVGRELGRQAALVDAGGQFAARLAAGQIGLDRSHVWVAGHVAEQVQPAVEGLQQVEVGDVGHAGLAGRADA